VRTQSINSSSYSLGLYTAGLTLVDRVRNCLTNISDQYVGYDR